MEKPLGFTHWIGYSISRERIVLINGKRYYYSVYVDTIDCDQHPIFREENGYNSYSIFNKSIKVERTNEFRKKLSLEALHEYRSMYMRELNKYRKSLRK